MGNGWIVRRGEKETPPIAANKLRELAKAGKLRPDDLVRREDQQEWQEARKVKGLFDSAIVAKSATPPAVKPAVSAPPVPTLRTTADPMVVIEPIHQPAPSVAEPARPLVIPPESRTKPCPFCSEPVLAEAKKCKHCGEIIDVALRAAEEVKRLQEMSRYAPPAPAAQPTQSVTQVVNVNVGQQAVKRWSPIVAGVLSLIIPGLGQMYKGQILNGLVWFILVVAGYFFLIVPGLILHLCCILGAMMGNPYK